jgi:xylulose-5-phosphate/fructose-6-phosphate phosphoketolase
MATLSSTDKASQTDSSLSAYGTARSTVQGKPLDAEEMRKIDAYWRASLYLCLGMLYLKANPLLQEPLSLEHTKPRLLGHWGSDPGQCFTYIHFNRLIKKYDLNAIFISGPGHGAPAVLSQAYLEGTYSEIYPACSASNNSHSRVVSAAMPRQKPLAASMKAASSATSFHTRTGQYTTTQI